MLVKIRNLFPGEAAVITGYEQGNSYYRQKLLSMGLIKGTVVRLIKTAPFGDPVQLELRGFKLSLRKTEADVLILEKTESEIQLQTGLVYKLRNLLGIGHGRGNGHGARHGRYDRRSGSPVVQNFDTVEKSACCGRHGCRHSSEIFNLMNQELNQNAFNINELKQANAKQDTADRLDAEANAKRDARRAADAKREVINKI